MFDNLGTNPQLNDDNLLSANTRHSWVADQPRGRTGAANYTYTSFEQHEDDCYLSAVRVNTGAAPHGNLRHWSTLKIRCRQLLTKLTRRIAHLPH